MNALAQFANQPCFFRRRSVITASAKNAGLADGWGVEAPSTAVQKAAPKSSPAEPAKTHLDSGWGVAPSTAAGVVQPTKQATKGKSANRKQAPDETKQKKSSATPAIRAPYMDMKSEQGILGLTLLQRKLALEGGGLLDSRDRLALRAGAQDAIRAKRQQKASGPGMQLTAPSAPAKKPRRIVYEDDNGETWEEEEDEDISDKPSFALTFDEEGTEYTEYDPQGNVVVRRGGASSRDTDDGWSELQAGAADEDDEDDDEDEEFDELDFSEDNTVWRQFSSAPVSSSSAPLLEPKALKQLPAGKAGIARGGPSQSTRDIEQLMGGEGASGAGMVQVEEEDWGLEEFGGSGSGRRSLMEEMGVVRRKSSKKVQEPAPRELDMAVSWGGSGGTTGMVDMEEQEALLSRLFKPHRVKELMEHQRAAVDEANLMRKGRATDSKVHSQLRIVGGSVSNRRLVSSAGSQTRPMMEKVRQAIFNMIQSQSGSVSSLPKGTRWLDLFAGTGSVGLEALSRGCGECHFVEMDAWVTRNVLGRNIGTCGFQRQSIVHTFKAEEFLKKAIDLPRFAGGAFDFISMCPPYLLVSYPELFSLLERSPLLHAGSILFVEYPKQLSDEVPETVGPLVKVRDRKYGRTWIAVYAPLEAADGADA